MNRSKRYSPEIRERAVRMVLEHEEEYDSQWAAIQSMAEKFGCTSETLRRWVRQAERDTGRREGRTTGERERIKELERENRELKRANEILRKASAYFAQAVSRCTQSQRELTIPPAGKPVTSQRPSHSCSAPKSSQDELASSKWCCTPASDA